MKRKTRPEYVKWSELSDEAKYQLLHVVGHPSNRPKLIDCSPERGRNRFAVDGSGWTDYYALAGTFNVAKG